MDQTSQLNELAASEIEQLQRDGVTVTPAEIVELNALGWAVELPETRRLLARGRPVEVGGAVLWPLTLRAIDWMERNSVPVESITPALGYAMAFGRSDGPEMDSDGREADKLVVRWFRSLRCTRNEFNEAVTQAGLQDVRPILPPDPDGKPMTLGDFVAFLQATCGADADFWERRCSYSYCLSVLSMWAMQNRVDKRPCAQDPRIIATRALGMAVDRIRQRAPAPGPVEVTCG